LVPLYVVTDSSDRDPVNPVPGTLRHAAIQEGPLWIVFAADMTIRLNEELLVNSYKTIDGCGTCVHIGTGLLSCSTSLDLALLELNRIAMGREEGKKDEDDALLARRR
jgi:hypothetical protein